MPVKSRAANINTQAGIHTGIYACKNSEIITYSFHKTWFLQYFEANVTLSKSDMTTLTIGNSFVGKMQLINKCNK